jgi:hypothetical protein
VRLKQHNAVACPERAFESSSYGICGGVFCALNLMSAGSMSEGWRYVDY